MGFILNLLSKIKLQHVLIITVVGLIVFSVWSFNEMKFQKIEKERQEDNYKNLRDLDSVKTAFLQFRTNKEIEEYINSNNELQELLQKSQIKTRRLKGLVYQKTKFIDSVKKKLDVTGIVEKIRKDIPHVETWQTKNECSSIKGNVTYLNDSLSVNVTNQEYNNATLITEVKKRKKWKFLFIKSRLFGKKYTERKTVTTCGDTETISIRKE